MSRYYQQHPLRVILWAGLFIRLVAAFFARGYGWHDDQFLIIEIAQSWVDGIDFYHWLPSADGTNTPEGFSFFYVGLHYLLFSLLDWMHLSDPQTKMVIVRLLHALWSMLIIFFGYKIARRLGNEEQANTVGWLLALFWIFPFLSVRNLVEYTGIPLLMAGLWYILQGQRQKKPALIFMAGLLMGMAFNIRFQTLLITGGVGLALLTTKQWKDMLWLATGTLTAMVSVQGTIDWMVWGKPFVQFIGYVDYNMHNAAYYVVSPWYTYLLFLLGIFIPPVSIFLFAGTLASWKKLWILFLPILIFLVFHSYYPNKQERFVVTIMPMMIVAGIIGWSELTRSWKQHRNNRLWLKGSWIFFWIINLILLLPVTTMYSKRARVESMSYLSRYTEMNHFLIEETHKNVLSFPPQFYLKKWIRYDKLMKDDSHEAYAEKIKAGAEPPDFILFFQPDDLELRVSTMKEIFPELEYETTIAPGFVDQVMYWLNPINDNQIITIYRNGQQIPDAHE